MNVLVIDDNQLNLELFCHMLGMIDAAVPLPMADAASALADVFDALTSTRPYKQGWEPGRAADCPRAGSGSQFDPRRVDALLAIQRRYQDDEAEDERRAA